MSLEELWELFPIVLSEHNPAWTDWAQEEMGILRRLLRPAAVRLHHVGSTAVGSIMAKPIVDILAVVPDKNTLAEAVSRLKRDGYLLMSQSESRVSFNKGYTPEGYADRVFHIHLRLPGDADEIFFRDYLNAHPDVAKEYEALKMSLCERYAPDRDAYTAAKTDFVRRYTSLAKQPAK